MDLIALAVPFFLIALVVELGVDRFRGTGFYRLNDALNSLSAGALSTTFGYFTKLLPIYLAGVLVQPYALFDIDAALFDTSARGLGYWLAVILAWDFCYYWAHRAGHEVSLLWAAHAVHHQSEEYNLSTALRQTSTDLYTWVFYLPLFLAGIPVEVIATANAIDLIYQFWVHTRMVGRLGWLDRVFVTPSNHRVHHAQNPVYIDRNYGGILIIWDRLFGSFQEELDEEPVRFGVRKPLASWNPFWANLQVYDYLLHDARRAARWGDKLGIWFRRTGWRPPDVERQYPVLQRRTDDFEKFDPPLQPGIRLYVSLQFLAAVLLVLALGLIYARDGLAAVVLPCLILWSGLLSLGWMLEGRPAALRFELLRLLAILPLISLAAILLGRLPVNTADYLSLLAGYLVLSLLGVVLVRRGAGLTTERANGPG